jgi:hypothetical protein
MEVLLSNKEGKRSKKGQRKRRKKRVPCVITVDSKATIAFPSNFAAFTSSENMYNSESNPVCALQNQSKHTRPAFLL